jgi:uncharacterized protein
MVRCPPVSQQYGRTAVMTLMTVCMTAALSATAPEGKGETVLEPFDYKGVTLHDSTFKNQFDDIREFYLRLPADDILRGYRLRAGLPAPGNDLGGNYLGHNTFGQVLSGLARMHAATGDPACKEKARALMQGWAECIAPDGFFFIVDDPLLPPYYYDKMVGGLVDLYLYCDFKEALDYLSVITDWAVANLDRARNYARPTGEGGGEWYTLSENLYRAYLATGDDKYRDFAEVWEYDEFWDLFRDGKDIFAHPMDGGWYHAYSHVNSLNSLAAAYQVKGDPEDLETLQKAWQFLWDTQLWATGGYGPDEVLMPREAMRDILYKTTRHFETQCGSWAVFKLGKHLLSFTGDARYGDWVELVLINGIGAGLNMEPDGRVFYYSNYKPNGAAKKNIHAWACCSGTRPQGLSDVHDLVFFRGEKGLYVNLFVPASVSWEQGKAAVTVRQDTRFPEEAATAFAVTTDQPAVFTLHVRVPGWLAGPMEVTVNGKQVSGAPVEKNWLALDRMWKDGDKVEITLPMAFAWSRLMADQEYPAAIQHGPVTMVARYQDGNPAEVLSPDMIPGSLVPVPGDPLNFGMAGDPVMLVRPFYQMKQGEQYFLYLDPAVQLARVSHRKMTFTPDPDWADFGDWRATQTIGATATFAFTGDRVAVQGYRYDDAGRMEVAVDGKAVGTIDQYGPERGEPTTWEFTGFGPGPHTLRLTLLPDKAEASAGHFVNVAGLELTE